MSARVDGLVAGSASAALATAVLYVTIVLDQSEQPAAWVLGILLVGPAAAGVAADRRVPQGLRLSLRVWREVGRSLP